MRGSYRFAKPAICLLAALLFCDAVCRFAAAQDSGDKAQAAPPPVAMMKYTEAPPQARADIMKVLRGDLALEGHIELFDTYLRESILAEMTLPAKVKELPELRRDFYVWTLRARPQNVRVRLNGLAMKTMQGILDDDPAFFADKLQGSQAQFPPVVKYNAMLVIALLDQKAAKDVGDTSPPVPMPEALDFMLARLKAAETPDYLRVGALIGIRRHCLYGAGISSAKRDEIIETLLGVARQSNPPAGRDGGGHGWMRREAIAGLGLLGYVGGRGEVLITLAEIIRDGNSSVSVRCAAADSLGKLQYNGRGLKPAPLAEGLGMLALDTWNQSRSRFGDYGPDRVRRQVGNRMAAIRRGLVLPGKIDPNDALVSGVITQVDRILSAVTAEQGDPATLLSSIDKACSELTAVLPEAAQPAAAEQPAAVAEQPASAEPAAASAPKQPEKPAESLFE